MKNILIVLIFILSLSVPVHAQDQDIFSRSNKLRRGAESNLPNLSIGEFYWANDVNKLYIGSSDGSKRVISFDTAAYPSATKKVIHFEENSGSDANINISSGTFFSSEITSGVINFSGFVPGRLYTMKFKGDYFINYTENTEGFDGGNYPIPSVTEEDVFQFIVYEQGSKVYFSIYGQGY